MLTQNDCEHCLILKAFLSLIHFVVSPSSSNNCLSYLPKTDSIHSTLLSQVHKPQLIFCNILNNHKNS